MKAFTRTFEVTSNTESPTVPNSVKILIDDDLRVKIHKARRALWIMGGDAIGVELNYYPMGMKWLVEGSQAAFTPAYPRMEVSREGARFFCIPFQQAPEIVWSTEFILTDELYRQPPMTQKEYLESDDPGCPICRADSEHIEGLSIDTCDGTAKQEMLCNVCGSEWTDTYTLSSYKRIS